MSTERTTHKDRMARIRAEHLAKVERVKADHRRRLAAHAQTVSESAAEIQLRQELDRELERIKGECDDDYTLTSRQAWRRHYKMLGLPLNDRMKEEEAIERIEGDKVHANDPEVVALRTWLDDVCLRESITVNGYLNPAIRQGKAARSLKTIWSPPVQSIETGLIKAHEVGHVVAIVDPDARWQAGEFGIGRVCPSDECAAWRWVMAYAPRWTDVEHAFMARCLQTYRDKATESEQFEIDWLTSQSGMREARLLRVQAATGPKVYMDARVTREKRIER